METSSEKIVSFPFEILTRIFKHVPNQTQIACQYVSKSWYYPARQLYYSTIEVRSRDVSKLVYCLESSSAGDMVKLLKINTYVGLTRDQLIRLIKACSNLQELQICNNISFFKWIMEEKSNLTLNNLWVITPLGRQSWRLTEQNNLFYLVAHKFRNSIETLHIPCTCSPVFDQDFESTEKYLSHFSNLKELSIIDGSKSNMIYLQKLLVACTRLEKLNMQLGHPFFDPTETVTSGRTTLYPTLHTLDIFLTTLSTDYMRYIMDRFVNMESCTIRINQNCHDWNKNRQDIERFLIVEYIPYVKKLATSTLNIKMNGSLLIGDFFTYYLYMYKNASIDAHFQIEDSRSERTDILLETQMSDYLSARFTFVRDFSFGSTELPYTKHLVAYGTRIHRLDINLCKSIKKAVDFGFILKQCSNAQHIEINIAQKQPREYSWCSLLEMYNSKPNISWGEEEETYCNDNLSVFKINGGMMTAALLNSISNSVPNLKKLSLMCCTFQPPDETTDFVSRFDMSSVKLKEFVLDTSMFYHPDRQYTQIVISSIEEGKSDYFIFDKSQIIHVSPTDFDNHCHSLQQNYGTVHTLEFTFKTIETMKVHIGKYAQQQVVENIFFLFPVCFSYKSIKSS